MNNRLLNSFLFLIGLACANGIYAKKSPSFSDWKMRCDTIPHYLDARVKNPYNEHDYSVTATDYAEFMHAVDKLTDWYANSTLIDPNCFVNEAAFAPSFFRGGPKNYMPFIQALRVTPGTEIIMFGDRHGDVRSTVAMIEELRTKGYFQSDDTFTLKPGVLLVGLGDYVDRGNAGVETFLTIMWLKLRNPEQVILVRGNHEDCDMCTNQSQFQAELKQKLGKKFNSNDLQKVNRIYDFMPAAVFIGSGSTKVDFLVGCHGFIELGYDPASLLELAIARPIGTSAFEKCNTLMRAQQIENLPTQFKKVFKNFASNHPDEIGKMSGISLTSPRGPIHLGWMWSYAIVDDGTKLFDYNAGNRTWQWGKDLTQSVLELWGKPGYSVSWIFRGHQHAHNYEYSSYGSIMHKLWQHDGVYRMWANDNQAHSLAPFGAFTLNVAPDNIYAGYTPQSTYPGFNFDTWIAVKTGASSDTWSMKIFNKAMFDMQEYPIWVDGKKIIPQRRCC